MSTITFDTLAYVTRLEKAGVARAQATAEAEALADALEQTRQVQVQEFEHYRAEQEGKELVTKGDLRAEMTQLRAEMTHLEAKFDAKLSSATTDIIKWNIVTIIAVTALVASIVKVLSHG